MPFRRRSVIRRGRRGYGRRGRSYRRLYSKRSPYGIARYGATAHMPRGRVSRSLALKSVELKTYRLFNAGYRVRLGVQTGDPWYGIGNMLVPAHNADVSVANQGCLNAPKQGTDFDEREGRVIALKSIHIRGNLFRPSFASTAPVEDDQVFVALVMDTQADASESNSEGIFSCVDGTPASNYMYPTSVMRNPRTTSRYRILSTRRVHLRSPGPMWVDGQYITPGVSTPFEMFVDLKGVRCDFIDAEQGVTSINNRALNLYACSMWDGTPGGPAPQQRVDITFQSSLRYVG